MSDSAESSTDGRRHSSNWRRWAIGGVLLACLAGGLYVVSARWAEIPWDVRRHFDNLDEVEFLTTSPTPVQHMILSDDAEAEGAQDLEAFRARVDRGFGFVEDYLVIDRRVVPDVAAIMDVIVDAVRANTSGAVASCFNPRHAIRDPHDPDNYILICFECSQLIYQCNGEKGSAAIADTGAADLNQLADSLGMERSRRAE